jgi:hypothetical protein
MQSSRTTRAKEIREAKRYRRADARLENATQALREAEERQEAELSAATRHYALERQSRDIYLRVWMKRERLALLRDPATDVHDVPEAALLVTQDELREAGAAAEKSRLSFDIEEDGETLRISETSEETT